jgi:hypothetical protein
MKRKRDLFLLIEIVHLKKNHQIRMNEIELIHIFLFSIYRLLKDIKINNCLVMNSLQLLHSKLFVQFNCSKFVSFHTIFY